MAKIAVIGGGFSGLSAACFAAEQGHTVTLFEKNKELGGRARAFSEEGFMFDMGPSWYWMPDVLEKFFNHFGKSAADYYDLVQLDPGFQIFFGGDDIVPVPANTDELYAVFERIEKGSAVKLKKYLAEAEYKYKVGMQQLVYRPALSWMEFAHYDVLSGVMRSHIFKSMSSYVRSFFKDPRLVALMEFPVLFLGAMPQQIPALYSLMNHAALSLGTWYPMGGMHRIVQAMQELAESLGVEFRTNAPIERISVFGNTASAIQTAEGGHVTDAIIASCDYHHVEKDLLKPEQRNYTEQYWDKRTLAPSCLIYYVGVSKRIKKLLHHNLFFDASLDVHAKDIYEAPRWPDDPLFYVCCPSKTDDSVAPAGMENLFILVPVAPGLEDTPEVRERYFPNIIRRMEQLCGDEIMPHILYRKSYCVNDFVNDYNAYKGNAYGLANVLWQTAILKPSVRNKKVSNLFYAGQLTVPGPGLPPSIISGQIAAEQVLKHVKSLKHERVI